MSTDAPLFEEDRGGDVVEEWGETVADSPDIPSLPGDESREGTSGIPPSRVKESLLEAKVGSSSSSLSANTGGGGGTT